MVTAAIKLRRLLLGRKAMKNLDSILKSRNITLLTKVCLVKAMVFSVVMYGCESWTTRKAEHQRIYAFELWCWRRLLRVPWATRRSNQSILKEISPEYSLEGLMLKLKLQYFGHLMENWLIGKDPDAGKDWRQEKKQAEEDEMVGWHHQLNGHEFEQTLGDSEGQGSLACYSPRSGKESETTEQPNNNNTDLWPLNILKINYSSSFLNVNLLVGQSHPTLCDPMDCGPPGSSVHGISQAGILEWLVISFSKGSFWTRGQTWVSCIAGRFFTIWALSNPKIFSHLFI